MKVHVPAETRTAANKLVTLMSIKPPHTLFTSREVGISADALKFLYGALSFLLQAKDQLVRDVSCLTQGLHDVGCTMHSMVLQ